MTREYRVAIDLVVTAENKEQAQQQALRIVENGASREQCTEYCVGHVLPIVRRGGDEK